MKRCLAMVLCLLFGLGNGLFAALPGPGGEELRWLVIRDARQEESIDLAGNIRTVASFASIGTTEMDVRDAPALNAGMLASFPVVLLAAESAGSVMYGPDLLAYIEGGGVLGVMIRGWAPDWMPAIGLSVCDAPEYPIGTGFRTCVPVFRDVLVTMSDESFGSSYLNLSYDPSWKKEIEYLTPAGTPVLLTREYGKGAVLYWNMSSLREKQLRGVVLFSILRSLPAAAASIFHTTLFQIDDSPPPAFGLRSGPVYRDLGLTDHGFYTRVWYPSVLALLQAFGIRATHFFCMNYRGGVQEPFPVMTDRPDFIERVLPVIASWGQEIALHGYNHQPLSTASPAEHPWPSEEAMTKALEAAGTLWDGYGLPPASVYAAPNNIIDETGRKALCRAFGAIRGVFGLYVGAGEYAGNIENRVIRGSEFGPDPQVPRLYNVPRFSSGMILTPNRRFDILNGVMSHGMINHFIHPDDMYDPSRAGRDWACSLEGLRNTLAFFDRLLPDAEKLPSSRFVPKLKAFLEAPADVSLVGTGTIWIASGAVGRKFWYLFSRKPAREPELTGARIVSCLEEGRLWVVELLDPPAVIRFQQL